MDVATAQTHLDAWLAADLAIAANKSYTIAGRSWTQQDAPEVRRQINYWQGVVDALNAEAAGTSAPGTRTAKWTSRVY